MMMKVSYHCKNSCNYTCYVGFQSGSQAVNELLAIANDNWCPFHTRGPPRHLEDSKYEFTGKCILNHEQAHIQTVHRQLSNTHGLHTYYGDKHSCLSLTNLLSHVGHLQHFCDRNSQTAIISIHSLDALQITWNNYLSRAARWLICVSSTVVVVKGRD